MAQKLEMGPDGLGDEIDTAEFFFRSASYALADELALSAPIPHRRAAFTSFVVSQRSIVL